MFCGSSSQWVGLQCVVVVFSDHTHLLFERGISLKVKEKPISFWKFVRIKTQTRSGISDLTHKDQEWIANDTNKATEKNRYFNSAFTKNKNKLLS